jgi:4-hydroxy-2-oxoheptanedioate aldolase
MSELPINRFKQAIAERRRQIGLWSQLRSPVIAEILGRAGFDWILLDTEHGPNEIPDIMVQLIALEPSAASAVVRVAWNDPVMIKRLLDLGAQSLLVPYVETAAEAAAAVAATRYPQAGIRGVASTMRANRFGAIENYHQEAAGQICVLVQVESGKALDNIDAIAAVEGIDGVFIGPSDLSAGLGHLGELGHPEVQKAIAHALARCKAAGKPAGILMNDEDRALEYVDMGFTFVAVGSDAGLIAKHARSLAHRFREAITR